jgi:hypothetical protein
MVLELSKVLRVHVELSEPVRVVADPFGDHVDYVHLVLQLTWEHLGKSQGREKCFFEKLSSLPGVQEVNSVVSLAENKYTTAVPLD